MRVPRWLTTLALVVLVLAGCTAQSGSDAGGIEQAVSSARDEAAPAEIGASVDEAAGEAAVDADRQVITTASATVVVDDPVEATTELIRLTRDAGGYVEQRAEHRPETGSSALPSAWLAVRVPSDALTGLVEGLESLGEVRNLEQDAQDVTRTVRDLDARITALQTSVDRLLGIMADAQTSEALISAESALSDRQAQLESLQSERAYLADQVAMSTLRVDLVARDDPTIESEGFLGGLETGWDALVSFASGLLVAVGVILPWLPVVLVMALVVLWLARRGRRRHAARDDGARPRAGAGPADEG